MIEKLNFEIPKDPNNQILREIYSTISTKLENNIEIIEKIIDFAKKEIMTFNEGKPNCSEDLDNFKNDNSIIEKTETWILGLDEQQLKILNFDLELIKNLSKFNITSRLLQKNDGLLNKLKLLFKDFETYFDTDNLNSEDSPLVKYLLSKTKNLLFNIFSCILSNRANSETVLSEHSDILNKIISDLKNNKLISKNENIENRNHSENNTDTNFDQKTLKEEALFLSKLANEYFETLAENGLKILNGTSDLKTIKENIIENKELYNNYEELIKKISVLDKDREFIEKLENAIANIAEICKKVEVFYAEHNEQIAIYKSQQNHEKEAIGEENLKTLNRSTTMNMNTMSNISSTAVKKMSLISRNILFSLKDMKFKSPISAKDNEMIEGLIEKIINHISKLHSENKVDKDEKRISQRNPLISRLLNTLKLLSVCACNHVLILELGLINFIENLQNDKENFTNNIYIYLETLDIAKNCTFSENSVPIFISSIIAEKILSDIIEMYDKPEIIANNLDMRIKFKYTNNIFSNLCKFSKGFNFVFEKLGMSKLIDLAKKTYNEIILEAVLEMILNYVLNHDKEKITNILDDIFNILYKVFKVFEKDQDTIDLLIKGLLLLGNISNDETSEKIAQYELPNFLMKYNLNKLLKNVSFFNALLFCLGKIVLNNIKIGKTIIDCGILKKIKENAVEHIKNLALIETLTMLLTNMLKNNIPMAQNFIEADLIVFLFLILEKILLINSNNNQNLNENANKNSSDLSLLTQVGNNGLININNNDLNNSNNLNQKKFSENDESLINSITLNIVTCFDSLTMYQKAIEYLANTRFHLLVLDTINIKYNEIEITKMSLHSLGNYFYNECGQNIKTLNFEKLLETLHMIQTKLYSNSDVLIYVNYIAGYLIKYMKEIKDKESLLRIILVPIKAQDWNAPLIINTLNIINDVFDKNKILQENFFGEIFTSLLNILKIHMVSGNLQVLLSCYKLILLFAKVYFNALEMVNEGLLNHIRDTFDFLQRTDKNNIQAYLELNDILFKILDILLIDLNNKKKASEIFIGKFILDLKNEDPKNLSPNATKIVNFLYSVLELKDKKNEFVQYSGVETLLPILKENMTNLPLIKNSFLLFSRLVSEEDEFKRLLKNLKVIDLVNEVSQSAEAKSDKEYSFISAALISDLNDIRSMLEKTEDLPQANLMKTYNHPIKPEIRNFVINGRLIRL